MSSMTHAQAQQLLAELEATLASEAAALRVLDQGALTALTARKLELGERLSQFEGVELGAAELESLRRIRRAAMLNQVLLVHARESVRHVLAQVAPGGARPSGLCVDVRG
jgi:hypothetical protein